MSSTEWPESRVRFHDFWAAAVDGPCYDKAEWQTLEKRYDAAYQADNKARVERILAEAEKLHNAHLRPI